MRYLLIVICLTGCNLFAPSESVRTSDAGTTDVAPADTNPLVDVATSADVSTRVDMRDTADQGPTADVPCVPETDGELCASLGAECGATGSIANVLPATFEAEDNVTGQCSISGGVVGFCNSVGTTNATFDAPMTGDYLFELVARADVFGDVPALAELSIDGLVTANLPVRETLPEAETLSVTLPLVAGSHDVQWRFANDAVFGGMDRNMYVDSYSVTGPLGAVPDRCGELRTLDCGSCATGETCGLNHANICDCPCPLADGTCAPLGTHPNLDCLECVETGWNGISGGCSDGNACTNDVCDIRAGLCKGTAIVCERDECEVGTCSAGACQFAAAADGVACGVVGQCLGGQCGCSDGTVVETNCTDNNDNDCDGLTNCADPDCDGQNCGAGNTCSLGACQ